MGPPTRRSLLRSASALLAAATAGCGGGLPDGPNDGPADSSRSRAGNVETSPESYELRNPEAEPAVWFTRPDRRGRYPDGTAEPASEGSTTPAADPENAERRGLIGDARTAASMGFAAVDGVDGARRFVEETDFESETIYLEQRSVGECYRLELCYVEWSETEIETGYGRYYRDADVACGVDDEDTAARLIRIPAALDPDRVNSHGSSWSSDGCRYPRHVRTATPESGGTAAASNESASAPDETASAPDESAAATGGGEMR